MSIWYFCKEASEALRALRDEKLDNVFYKGSSLKVLPNSDYWDALKFVQKVCPHCLEYLPEIQEKILRGQKLTPGTCCGAEPCEILELIKQLRPVTKDKLLDGGWKAQVLYLNDLVCCLRKQIQDEWKKDVNTFPHITELPNTSIKGLPDFKYPNYRVPPLWKLKIKPNKDSFIVNNKGFTVIDGKINYNGDKKEPDDLFDIKAKPSWNVNGSSANFGLQWRTYVDYPTSPFEFFYDLLCEEDVIKFNGTVSMKIQIKMPNLAFNPHITINIDPCLAKYLPPLANPTNEIKTLKLGDGEEFGIYENFKIVSHNFGTGFDPNSEFISPLVKTAEQTFEEVTRKGKDVLHGLTKEISFPKYGKGREWTKK